MEKGPQRRRMARDILSEEGSSPREFYLEREVSEDDRRNMMTALNRDRANLDWWRFSKQAMQMTILFPDRKKDLGLDQAAWDGMQAQLDMFREEQIKKFTALALAMHVLSASKITISEEHGLELTYAHQPVVDRSPLPPRAAV